jgi:hypothetical protein
MLPVGPCHAEPRYWAPVVGNQCTVAPLDELDWEMCTRRLPLETIKVLLFLRRANHA